MSSVPPLKKRSLNDCTHEYLVERVILNEQYIADIIEMLGSFHPYLGAAINDISNNATARFHEMEKRHPPSGIILPH